MLHAVVVGAQLAYRQQLAAVVNLGLIFGEEGEYLAVGIDRPPVNAREVFLGALHPQLVERDLRELGTEFPFGCREYLNVCRADMGRILQWINEIECFTTRHCSP